MTLELPQPPYSLPNERLVYEVSSSRNTYLMNWKLGLSLHRLTRSRTAQDMTNAYCTPMGTTAEFGAQIGEHDRSGSRLQQTGVNNFSWQARV